MIPEKVIEAAKVVAKQHPTVNTFFGTEDGTIFLEGSGRHAKNHANSLNGQVYEIQRTELLEAEAEKSDETGKEEGGEAGKEEGGEAGEKVVDKPSKKAK